MGDFAILVRRFLVVAALMYWQGGFVFYAAIVVPIGNEVLGSPERQAAITRQVAQQINWSGAVALIVFAWDLAATRTRSWLRSIRIANWLGMGACLIVLALVYHHLDRLFHGEEAFLDDHSTFRPWHRAYLWVSTAQFVFTFLFTIATLIAWRGSDRNSADSSLRAANDGS